MPARRKGSMNVGICQGWRSEVDHGVGARGRESTFERAKTALDVAKLITSAGPSPAADLPA